MNFIIGDCKRGLERLIEMSAAGEGTIVTTNQQKVKYIVNLAKELDFDIPTPIDWEMLDYSSTMKNGPFLLDGLGVILSNYGITNATIDD